MLKGTVAALDAGTGDTDAPMSSGGRSKGPVVTDGTVCEVDVTEPELDNHGLQTEEATVTYILSPSNAKYR